MSVKWIFRFARGMVPIRKNNKKYLNFKKNTLQIFLHMVLNISFYRCGRSSGVERNLAKVDVEGSNPFTRSNNTKPSLVEGLSY